MQAKRLLRGCHPDADTLRPLSVTPIVQPPLGVSQNLNSHTSKRHRVRETFFASFDRRTLKIRPRSGRLEPSTGASHLREMSSGSGLPPSSSKVVSSTNQSISPHSQTGPSSFVTESGSQRRTGGSGSFGAGSTSRDAASPRNSQGLRKQSQKSQRRARLADEDAIAESVSIIVFSIRQRFV